MAWALSIVPWNQEERLCASKEAVPFIFTRVRSTTTKIGLRLLRSIKHQIFELSLEKERWIFYLMRILNLKRNEKSKFIKRCDIVWVILSDKNNLKVIFSKLLFRWEALSDNLIFCRIEFSPSFVNSYIMKWIGSKINLIDRLHVISRILNGYIAVGQF